MRIPGTLRLAFRRIRRSPGYAAAFVLTLGLGIGINTAIFTVVNGVLLEPLPYQDAERLVYLRHEATTGGFNDLGFSFTEVRDLRAASSTIDEFVEYGDANFGVVSDADPHTAVGGLVSSNYFQVLGLQPQLGRTLEASDDGTGVEPVAVLTDGYWRRAFGGDPAVIGKTVTLNSFGGSRQARIVGVLRPGTHYTGSRQQDFFVNYASNDHYGSSAMLDERNHRMTSIFARLAPGVSVSAAQSELSGVYSRMQAQAPDAYPERLGLQLSAASWREELTAEARPMLLVLMGTVALVLLLACANVANLTLTRLIRRERELSVQTALGANPLRIRAEMLVENLVLATMGAGLGVGLAAVGSTLLINYASRYTVRTGEIGIDLTVLAVTALVAIAAALVLAWVPPLPGLGGLVGSAGGTSLRVVGVNRKQLQRGLVVGQLALCFTLVVGATLLVRSLINLNAVDSGLEYQSVVTMDLPNMAGMPMPQNLQFMEQLTEEARAYPGVRAAAFASHTPFTEANAIPRSFRIEGSQDVISSPAVMLNTVSKDYFDVLGIRLLAGRAFEPGDVPTAQPVALINASLARFLFQDESPIGRTFEPQQFNGQFGAPVRVVGVVEDTREYGLAEGVSHTLYFPTTQSFPGQSLLIRAAGDPTAVIEHMRTAVRQRDATRPVENVATLENLRFEDMAPQRLNATLFTAFAALALVIATVGVLGVLGFSVTQRTREFGLRMALGAPKGQVLRMVLGEGGVMIAIALGIGALASLTLSRFLGSILFEVTTTDPLTYLIVAAILSGVALFGAYLPARRATSVDPGIALRAE